jgi:hypothetical protein
MSLDFFREVVHAYGNDAYRMAGSQHAEEFKKITEIEETEIAEIDFGDALKLVEDDELREKLDAAAGKLTAAYEKYGYIIGYLSQSGNPLLWSDDNKQRIRLPIPRKRR